MTLRARPTRRRAARALLALVLVLAGCTAAPQGTAPTLSPAPASTAPTVSPSPQTDTVVIAVKGDWGAGTRAQRQITRQMCAMRETEGFDIVMTTGDNFYPSGSARRETYDHPERCLLQHPKHDWRATWGNHDGADSTATLLGAERYYSWSAGSADFFALDSNQASDTAQRAWLIEQLSASTARYKIAYFHHPPYTSGSVHQGYGAVRHLWVRLFEQHGVDLVLAGHNHIYERFFIDGIHYVTTGGGGAALYRCTRVEGAPSPLLCLAEHHFLLLRVEPGVVEVRAIARDGRVLDRFSVR